MTVATALRRTEQVSGWTPASLSPYLWLDANQLALNDGDAISTFTDSSGNGRDFTSSGGNRPTFKTNIINGKPAARFTAASSHFMSCASLNFGGGATLSVWAVITATAGADYVTLEHSSNFNTNQAFVLLRNSNNAIAFGASNGSSLRYNVFTTTGTLTTTARAFIGTWNGALTTNEAQGYLDSTTASGTVSPNNNLTNSLGTYTAYLGARAGTSFFLNGDIAEVGATTGVLGSSDISSLMSYLGTKYGITIT